MRKTLSVAVVLLSLTACGKKKEGGTETPPAGSGSGSAAAPVAGSGSGSGSAAAPATPPAAGGKGLAAAGNDAAVVAVFKGALACKPDENGDVDSECPGMKAFSDSNLFEDGKADATLLNAIEDSDERVRYLAYDKFSYAGEKTWQDKAAAERILAVAEGEKVEKNQREVAPLVARLDMKATGAFERVKKYYAAGSKDVKRKLARVVSSAENTKNDEVWAWHKSLLNDPEPEVAREAIGAYFGNPSNLRKAEVCVIYKENFGHKDAVVASKAAAQSSGAKECIADLDAAIAEVEKRAKAKDIPSDSDFLTVLANPFNNDAVTPAQVAKKTAVLKAIVTNTGLPDNIRRGALEKFNEADPKAGKALATSLLKDKGIGDYAKSVAEKK